MAQNTQEESQNIQTQHRTAKGYKSFTTAGLTIGTGDYGDETIEILSSHGYQFNPYFYLGAGLGITYHTDWETLFLPIFANARVNLMNANFIPFIDFKIGYSPFDGTGLYVSPSIGTSFFKGKKSAISFSIGYTLQQTELKFRTPYAGRHNETGDIGGITLRLGLEF